MSQSSVPFGYSYDQNAPGGLVRLPLPPNYIKIFPGTVQPGATLPSSGGILPGDTIVPLSDPGTIAAPAGILPGDTGFTPLTTQPVGPQSDTERLKLGLPPIDTTGNPNDPITPQVTPLSGPSKLSQIEELAIRLALALVGIVLVYAGITIGSRRAASATNPVQLAVKVVKGK